MTGPSEPTELDRANEGHRQSRRIFFCAGGGSVCRAIGHAPAYGRRRPRRAPSDSASFRPRNPPRPCPPRPSRQRHRSAPCCPRPVRGPGLQRRPLKTWPSGRPPRSPLLLTPGVTTPRRSASCRLDRHPAFGKCNFAAGAQIPVTIQITFPACLSLELYSMSCGF